MLKITIPVIFGFLNKNPEDGFNAGSLNFISARPGCGQTAIAEKIANHFAKKRKRVLYFSPQANKKQASDHLIVNHRVPVRIWQISRAIKTNGGAQAVIIDYRQKMFSKRQGHIFSEPFFRRLKKFAVTENISIICLLPLLRNKGQIPTLNSMSKAGISDKHADTIIFLHTPLYFADDIKNFKPEIELIVAKNRFGQCGTLHIPM